jgi:hypothetical protein|tara:strand:- start:4521 stop:5504 length:984 start_codon:yes stop_codon:yes gene_type:complete
VRNFLYFFLYIIILSSPLESKEVEIKSSITKSYEPGFFFKKPKSKDIDRALEEIRKNMWESYTSTFSDAKMKQYLMVEEQVLPEIDKFFTSLSVVDIDVSSELKTFTVYARGKINDTAVNARLSFLSKAGQTSSGDGSPFTFIFIAKQAEKVLDFKDLDSLDSEIRKSASYSYKSTNSSFIDTSITNILSTAGFEVISYSDISIECGGPDLSEIAQNLSDKDNMDSDLRREIIEACRKCDIDYLAIGILDIGIKSKVNNQDREISVSVQSQVWDIQKKLPRVIASVGPITSNAKEKDDITTIKKALVDPSESAARNIVDQLNAKNLN